MLSLFKTVIIRIVNNVTHFQFKNVRMSKVTIATKTCESAHPIKMQVSFELLTFLRIFTFLNLLYLGI